MYVHEQLFVLTLNPDTGKLRGGDGRRLALAASAFSDLLLGDVLHCDEATRLAHQRGTAPDNPVLRAAFEEVTRKPRRKFAGHIAGLSSAHFRDTALRQLHKKGWVEECETTAWLLFPALGYRLKDGEIVTKVVARMRAVLDRSRDQDAVGTALVALAYQAKLLPYFLSSEEIAAAKTRLTAITRGADATAAVRSAIASIDAALAASITANAAVVASID